MMAIEQLKTTDEEKYGHFIKEHSNIAAFEHTLPWRNILQNNFGFIPYFLIHKNSSEKIDGILPLFKAKSIFGTRFVSTPYAIATGIIAENKPAEEELVSSAKELCIKEKASFVEIREKTEKNYAGYQKNSNVFNFSLQLSNNTDEIWKKLPKGSIRWGIKKSQNSGLTWSYGNSSKELDDFFRLFLKTRKHRGVPGYPYQYFQDIITSFGENVRIYLAKKDQQPIAAIFLIYYQKEVRYAFAGATYNKELLNLQPYHLILWEAIKDACARNYKIFNFGGATLNTNDGGLYEFKRKWSDKIENTNSYFYCPKSPKDINNQNLFLLNIAGKIWQKLPLPIIKFIGPYVIKQFV